MTLHTICQVLQLERETASIHDDFVSNLAYIELFLVKIIHINDYHSELDL